MNLPTFTKTTVQPGEPLTAQGWNDIVNAIDGAYQFLLATQHTVRVTITNPGIDLEQVRVTASRSAGAPVEAVRPIPPGTEHVLSRLEAGDWTITAEAPGYAPATKPVSVADAGETPIQMALQKAGAFMPDLFGLTLADAKASLAQAQIPIDRLFDFNGRELVPSIPDNDGQPVLVQLPPPAKAVPAGGKARLVIGVPVQVEPAVAVPSLTSLTQQEAQKALEAVGLTLGKVSFVQRAATSTAVAVGNQIPAPLA
ncbi:MAG TPA: hypothetical protein VF173_28435 [Thermoanaerobaculia bacterium]|nr:hypothetical protein [Thermoanaerobaculia bacterium]